MKVKTFTGTNRATVDKQVNDWLAKSNVTVRRTNVAFKALKQRGPAITGRTLARRRLGMRRHSDPPHRGGPRLDFYLI
jgi:hypothetical protein